MLVFQFYFGKNLVFFKKNQNFPVKPTKSKIQPRFFHDFRIT